MCDIQVQGQWYIPVPTFWPREDLLSLESTTSFRNRSPLSTGQWWWPISSKSDRIDNFSLSLFSLSVKEERGWVNSNTDHWQWKCIRSWSTYPISQDRYVMMMSFIFLDSGAQIVRVCLLEMETHLKQKVRSSVLSIRYHSSDKHYAVKPQKMDTLNEGYSRKTQ